MKYTNLHTHSILSDGRGEIEEYILSAIDKKMEGIGFSEHSPIPFYSSYSMKIEDQKKYIDRVLSLKEKYKDRIKVYLGMEIEYIENIDEMKYIEFNSIPLDYYIGAIHYIYSDITKKYVAVDESLEVFNKLLQEGFNNDIKGLYTKYYETIRMMIKEYKPPIIAHMDLIKKNNENERYFSETEKEYINQVLKTLDTIKETDSLVEVNTGAIARGYKIEPYPSQWILKECKKRDIKIILSADSHEPKTVDFMFDYLIEYIKNAGYDEIFLPKNI